ncbi:hypothetical protein LENED_009430 [Lentinula edodes]|uniref:Uncharacterized protein n=1 Tax=Lentinula edodes TaxID=5353 RepID=A0A1Q3EJS5_LENED|nr:hypothetical protein LENED_009430 [Lentinula edodes]
MLPGSKTGFRKFPWENSQTKNILLLTVRYTLPGCERGSISCSYELFLNLEIDVQDFLTSGRGPLMDEVDYEDNVAANINSAQYIDSMTPPFNKNLHRPNALEC